MSCCPFIKKNILDKFKDKCGVFGIYGPELKDITMMMYYGLFSLQHRGQESTGIVTSNFNDIRIHVGQGLVNDVFNKEILAKLSEINPKLAIGHVRYATAGSKGVENAQPLVVKVKDTTIALAHNGNLVNSEVIREDLLNQGITFKTTVDTEVIINLIARHYVSKSLEDSIIETTKVIKGSYSLFIMTKDKLIGLRDPYGIRPLCIGQFPNGSYVLASESCTLDTIGAKFVRDVKKGEIVTIDANGLTSKIYNDSCKQHTCIFEYVYFARPDSTIDDINVYLSRVKQGEILYREHPLKADMVIPSPDSGVHAAMGYSNASGIPYGCGLLKNRYIARTFIKPTQELRERDVHIKLNPLSVNIKGKDLILIDDSVVRGTTTMYLVRALKKAGAKKVNVLLASPMVKWPCHLGIDTANKDELIAANYSLEEIREKIGADYLGFISIKGLIESCNNENKFCCGCFDGKYPVEDERK